MHVTAHGIDLANSAHIVSKIYDIAVGTPMRSAEESEMSVPLVFRLNSRCSESQLGSAGTSSSQPIENCSAPVEGEGSHLQNPRQCSIINSNLLCTIMLEALFLYKYR